MKVKDCLRDNCISAGRGTPLKKIIETFKQKRINVLPVTDSQGYVAGIITLDDITSVFQPESANISELLKTVPFLETVPENEINIDYISPEMGILVVADEIKSSEYFTFSGEGTIAGAYSFMKAHNAKFLVVLDEEEKLSGIIGIFDILYSMFRDKGIVD